MFLTILALFVCQIMEYSPNLCFACVIWKKTSRKKSKKMENATVCVATNKNYVATQTAAFSIFLLLFFLFSLFFQIIAAKHKVGENSII